MAVYGVLSVRLTKVPNAHTHGADDGAAECNNQLPHQLRGVNWISALVPRNI